MPNDDPVLKKPDTPALPESASASDEEDEWGSDDATNDDHDLDESADEKKDWDPWRGWCGPRGYQDYHTFRRHRLAAAKEQMHVDKSAGSKDGDAAHLDLRDRDRPDLERGRLRRRRRLCRRRHLEEVGVLDRRGSRQRASRERAHQQ